MQIYIAGIHTNAGKTHASAAICASFGYDYFKLIQAGYPKDSDTIRFFSPCTHIFQEAVFLQTPASPHIGKMNEQVVYNACELMIPKSENLIIEFAGGILSPMDENYCVLDYIKKYPLPTILVGQYYVGSINHTLLSIEVLRHNNIFPLCLIMCGERDLQIDAFIKKYSPIDIIHLDYFDENNFFQKIQSFKEALKPILKETF